MSSMSWNETYRLASIVRSSTNANKDDTSAHVGSCCNSHSRRLHSFPLISAVHSRPPGPAKICPFHKTGLFHHSWNPRDHLGNVCSRNLPQCPFGIFDPARSPSIAVTDNSRNPPHHILRSCRTLRIPPRTDRSRRSLLRSHSPGGSLSLPRVHIPHNHRILLHSNLGVRRNIDHRICGRTRARFLNPRIAHSHHTPDRNTYCLRDDHSLNLCRSLSPDLCSPCHIPAPHIPHHILAYLDNPCCIHLRTCHAENHPCPDFHPSGFAQLQPCSPQSSRLFRVYLLP
mmetsp:Transcript_10119/g.15960  ORF Transcript_10119/g.15960 Transcript_10119/m.15960 type:complete len:285 (+) Transcript_10119:113-967(+)